MNQRYYVVGIAVNWNNNNYATLRPFTGQVTACVPNYGVTVTKST